MGTPKKRTYRDTTYTVSTTPQAGSLISVSVDGQESLWRVLAQREGKITLQNSESQEILSGAVVETASSIDIWVKGQVLTIDKPNASAHARATTSGPKGGFGPILAPMPGTILKILVAHGESVEAKAPLMIMESMKMELTIRAPQAGWVSTIAVKPGEMVAMQTPLLSLNPLEEPTEATGEAP